MKRHHIVNVYFKSKYKFLYIKCLNSLKFIPLNYRQRQKKNVSFLHNTLYDIGKKMHNKRKSQKRALLAVLVLGIALGTSYSFDMFSNTKKTDISATKAESETFSLEILTEMATQMPSEKDNKRLLGNAIAVEDFSKKADEVKEILSVKNANDKESSSFFSSLSSSFSSVADLDYFDENNEGKLVPMQAPSYESVERSTSSEVAEIKKQKDPNVEITLSGYELKDNEFIIRKEVVRGDTIGVILEDFVPRKQLYVAIKKAKPIRNIETVRIGQSYEIVHDGNNNLIRYEYEVDLEETFVLQASLIKPEIDTTIAQSTNKVTKTDVDVLAQELISSDALIPSQDTEFSLEIDTAMASIDELNLMPAASNDSQEDVLAKEEAELALVQTAQSVNEEVKAEANTLIKEYIFNCELVPVVYDIKLVSIDGRINDSLSVALAEANEGFSLAYSITRIFSDKIDFFSDVQKGDSFKLLVEKKYKDGKFVKYGKTLAAFFVNRNKEYTAFRFEDTKGHSAYFDERGHALQGLLLKSPLDYTRISSGYTMNRRHPILGVVRPHQGIDYAAPSGTPIVSIGDGTVTFVGWKGGYGKTIVVRHTNGIESQYAHMRGYAKVAKKGAKVSKGQTIGYVGSTGLSTGPHLDFRVKQNGKFINPASVVSEAIPPLRGDEKDNFLIVMDKINDYLNGTKSLSNYNPNVNLQDNEG